MPSPFPGMDPYIERPKIWVDFHNRLADEMSAQLNARIRPAYFARLTPYTTYEVVVQIDYHQPTPSPELWPEEAKWVERLLMEIRITRNQQEKIKN